MDEGGSGNPAPYPRINVTLEPFCADYYMEWMLCHITSLLHIHASDFTNVNDRNYFSHGQVLFSLMGTECQIDLFKI